MTTKLTNTETAAAAPDKAKLKAFAAELRSMTKPELTDKRTATALRVRIDDLTVWCETERNA